MGVIAFAIEASMSRNFFDISAMPCAATSAPDCSDATVQHYPANCRNRVIVPFQPHLPWTAFNHYNNQYALSPRRCPFAR